MKPPRLTILAIGAHPDDGEVKAAGAAALWADRGHRVVLASVTDGSAGHHETTGPPLAERRRREALAAAQTLGAESVILGFPDGYLEPSLDLRRAVIGLIRRLQPALVLTHRPQDYHPDHRYTSQAVLDAAFTVTVPAIFPDTPALRRNPAMAYFADTFTKPVPFQPDLFLPIDAVAETKLAALHCHESQMYEWLPYLAGTFDQVPTDDAERLAWLHAQRGGADQALADRYRQQLIEQFGEETGRAIGRIEAFESGEHGGRLTDDERAELFGPPGD